MPSLLGIASEVALDSTSKGHCGTPQVVLENKKPLHWKNIWTKLCACSLEALCHEWDAVYFLSCLVDHFPLMQTYCKLVSQNLLLLTQS